MRTGFSLRSKGTMLLQCRYLQRMPQYCSGEEEIQEYNCFKASMRQSRAAIFSEDMSCARLKALATAESNDLLMTELT